MLLKKSLHECLNQHRLMADHKVSFPYQPFFIKIQWLNSCNTN